MRHKIDTLSIIMIVLFAAVIVFGLAAGIYVALRDDNSYLYETIDMNELGDDGDNEKKLYSTPEEIVEAFENICIAGDIEALYDLYYDDFLTKTRENLEDTPSKEIFDDAILNEMLGVAGVEIYKYGDIEMPATQSPASYANYIYARTNNGETLPMTEDMIEDCANLVVYSGGYQTNHFIVKIDGAWYFIV